MSESGQQGSGQVSDESDQEAQTMRPRPVSVHADPLHVELSALSHYGSSLTHRPVVRSVTIRNLNWVGDAATFTISLRSQSASGRTFLRPHRYEIEAISRGDSDRLEDLLRLEPDHGTLAQIDEAESGQIIVEIFADDVIIGRAEHAIEFLAYNQFMLSPGFHDSFASFVVPNHPVVGELMVKVRDRLRRDTGSGSTEGYQAGAGRVDQIMAAIWSEVVEMQIDYSNPPASFEGFGQKIRTPDLIVTERAATCLDSTMLLASMLSAAGLSPLVVFCAGHAFVACWTIDAPFRPPGASPVINNANHISDLTQSGQIVGIETTMACAPGRGFAEALEASRQYFEQEISQVHGLIDVEKMFAFGVRTIPTRAVVDGQIIVNVEAAQPFLPPPSSAATPLETPSAEITDERERLDTGDAPPRVRRWLDALLDTSRRNSLIDLKSTPVTPGSGRSVKAIDLPIPEAMLASVENRIMSGEPVQLVTTTRMAELNLEDPSLERTKQVFESTGVLPLNDPAAVAHLIENEAQNAHREGHGLGQARMAVAKHVDGVLTDAADKMFRSLQRAADDLEQQSASNQLYLCVGTLLWTEPAKSGRGGKVEQLRSPLFIVPIRISGSAKTQLTVTLDEGAEITPNYCLMEKLRSEMNLTIPDLETPVLDDAGIDVDLVISKIRQQLGGGRFGEIRVEATATLAILDFASFRTWKDLKDNWATFMRNDVVRHLIETPDQSFINDPVTLDEDLLCPIPCDESQLEAVAWAAEGRSFVLEGPPGTGKSQTIANLIAASMALGKRILFVAEKQVALEVVSRRLAAIGLGPFCIVIHHESVTPDGIRQQLRASLDFAGIDRSNEWQSSSLVLGSIIDQLDQYRDSITEANTMGHNLWSAQQELLRVGEPERLELDPQVIDAVAAHDADIERSLLALETQMRNGGIDSTNPWQICDVSEIDDAALDRVEGCLTSLAAALGESEHLSSVLAEMLDLGDGSISAEVDAALQVASCLGADEADVLTRVADPAWQRSVDEAVARWRGLLANHSEALTYFAANAYGIDVTPQMAAATEAVGAGLLSRKKKTAALAALLAPITVRPEPDPAKVVGLLQQLPAISAEVAAVQHSIADLPGISLPVPWDPADAAACNALADEAARLVGRATVFCAPAATRVRTIVEQGGSIGADDVERLRRAMSTWAEFTSLVGASESSLRRWRAGRSVLDAIAESMPKWRSDTPRLLELRRWADVIGLLGPLRAAGLDDLAERIVLGEESETPLHTEYLRARAAVSRRERLDVARLGRFDRRAHDAVIEDLVRRDGEHKQLMRTVIPHRLVERRPFRPGIRMGDVGKLDAELTRKVRRISLPKLIREHGETVTQLTPCFLMSPDAVARLLPADSQFFDIVVFDEASQIRVANAIPAMGRAKSVVVVGDSQQMPPSARVGGGGASAAGDGDIGEDVWEDLESILVECRESNIPALMLKCHYRSRHEGLITFSNRYFYESELVTFPAPDAEITTPISWHQIDGHFVRSTKDGASGDDLRTNEEEAQAIVAEARRRLNDPTLSSKSIGIVTLNEQQRRKILTKLSESGDRAVERAMSDPDPERRLFVSALEQVQGDERDVIMISVAFSYQEIEQRNGTVKRAIPLNFGPMNNAGGERRLNVAVTRAKEEMVVFCSFNPDDMDLKGSSSIGLARLKSFLTMARDSSEGHRAALGAREAAERDHYRRHLAGALKAAGIGVREDVGLSKFRIDLAVGTEPGSGQFLAVLLDGPEWAGRSTAYDREVLPDGVLRGLGWRRIGRVWLPGAVLEPDHVVTSVLAEVRRERCRLSLSETLARSGFEVREDSRLFSMAIDLAVRRPGRRRWATAVRITGADLFRQSVPYPGDMPSAEVLSNCDVINAMVVTMDELDADPDRVLARLEAQVDEAERDADDLEPPAGAASDSDDGDVGDDREADGAGDGAGGSDGAPTVTASVETAMMSGVAAGASSAEPVVEAPGSAPEAGGASVLAHSEIVEDYVAAEGLAVLGETSVLDSDAPGDIALVRRAIEEILAIESPIHEDRLGSILVGRFNLARLRGARLETIRTRHFSSLAITDHGFGRFVWRDAHQLEHWLGYRPSAPADDRDLNEVAPEELVNAMVDLVAIAHSVYEEEMIRTTAEAFGRKRLTAALRERLEAVIQWGLDHGWLAVSDPDADERLFVEPEHETGS